jgi:hypothetical protein
MQKTFPADAIRRLIIADIAGELVVRGWDDRTVNVESESNITTLRLEGETLIIGGTKEGVVIAVPYETSIQAMRVADDVSIVNVSQVELREAKSDCFLKGIHGEVSLGRIHGELSVEDVKILRLVDRVDRDASFVDVESLKAVGIGGDVNCKNVHDAQFQHGTGGDFEAENVDVLYAGNVGRDCVIHGNGHTVVNLAHVGLDLEIHAVAKLQGHHIGQSCEVYDSNQAEVVLGNIGNELKVAGALLVEAHNVGRECELRDIQGDVSIKNIGTHAHIAGVGGDLRLGHVGAQAEIRGVVGKVELGQIGGNLELQAQFLAESIANLRVGGNATIQIPEDANVTVQALAGGNVMDEKSGTTYQNQATLVYGEGVAQVKVKAGGNVRLRGSVVSSATGKNNWGWNDWDWKDWRFVHDTDYWGIEMASAMEHKERHRQRHTEAQQRRAEEQRRHAERRARGARLNIRFNEREWRVDPAHIDHIVEQARQAAADGIQGAFEAVDQALRNMHLSTPVPPYPPMSPYPPAYPGSNPVVSPVPPYPPVSHDENEGDTDLEEIEPGLEESESVHQEQPIEANETPINVEQEREAILRMIAEGRITPDEGDMLLEALN